MRVRVLGIIIALLVFMLNLYASPAKAETVNLKFSTVWPRSLLLVDSDKKFIEIVDKLSSGKIKIKLYYAGEIVPSNQLLSAVSNGVIDGGFDWPGYWVGNNSAFSLLGSYPMLLTAADYQMWIYQGGGLEIYNKIYGKFGVVYFPTACNFSESGVRSNKPIKSLQDYKGLKIRMAGKPQGEILKKLGASQVMISASELYQALEKGVIDGAEFAMPSIDYTVGIHEVTKYWCAPGWHQPGSPLGLMINKNTWNKLSDLNKNIIQYAAMACYTWSTAYFEYKNIDATKKILAKGVEVTKLSDADLQKIQALANKIIVEESKKNPLFKEVAKSQIDFLKSINQWKKISTPFSYGRVIDSLPNLK